MKRNLLQFLLVMAIAFGSLQTVIAQTCISESRTNTPWTYIPYFDSNRSSIEVREGSGNGVMQWFEGNFSLDMWLQPRWHAGAGANYFLFSAGPWDDDYNSLFIYFESYDNDNKWRIRISDGNDADGNSDVYYDINYSADFYRKWKHLTLTYDDNTIRLYIDGKHKRPTKGGAFEFNKIPWGHCRLGGHDKNIDEDFRGYISGFRIWTDRKLTSSEVDYIWDKTFDGVKTFASNKEYLNKNLTINMYTAANNIYSLVSDKQMNESGIKRSPGIYHPARPPRIRTLTAERECTSIHLDWTIGTGATPLPTFYIYRKKEGQKGFDKLLCRTNSRSYDDDDPNLEPGVNYVYMVESMWHNRKDPLHYNNGYYDSEDDLTVTTSLKKYPQVTNFRVINDHCNGEVELGWNKLSITPNDYYIKYQVENGSWRTLETDIPNTSTTYTHIVDVANYSKTISYKIDGGGDGCYNYSNTIKGSTNMPCTKAPSNVLSSVENGSIKVTWDFIHDDIGGPPTDFKIYRRIGTTGDYDPLVNNINVKDREYIDADASMCINYYYKVEAYNSCNSPAAPPNSAVTTVSTKIPVQFDNIFSYTENTTNYAYFDASKGYFNQKVIIDWTINPNKVGDVNSYEIYRRKANQTYSLLTTINNANATYYEDNTAEANELYEYLIRATGDCAGTKVISDSLVTIGFRTNTGIVAGKITFKGGNAVENAEVRINSTENIQSSSLIFNGINNYMGTDAFANDSLMYKPFSVETWIKPELMESQEKKIIFSGYSGIIYLALKNMRPICGINKNIINENIVNENPIITLESDTILKAGTWYHLAINFLPYTGQFQLYINGELVQEAILEDPIAQLMSIGIESLDLLGAYELTIGSANGSSNFYSGNMDEIRIWQEYRDSLKIKADYIRVIEGSEENLIGYYRLDEAYGTAAYDISKKNSEFNKRDLVIPNGNEASFPEWSTKTPSFEQLHPSGITNANGNYIIKGIHYSGSGNIFGVSPFLGVHKFNPTDINLFIGDSEPVHNNIDFVDQSSFRVTGFITYENTNMPVSGAYVKIDNDFIQGADNQVVVTKADGSFDIQVPIGEHYITVEKFGHTFVDAYYPLQHRDSTINKHFFNEPIYNVRFYDNTTVKLAGRVVGGAVEAAKGLASRSNPTKNNLGQCKITFTTEKGYILDISDNEKTVLVIQTDATTGLYEINLPPEVYKIDTIRVNNEYNFLDGESEIVSLTDCFMKQYTVDTLVNEGKSELDTAYVYNLEKNWIWRSTPQISVDNPKKTKFLGDSEYIINVGSDAQDTIQIASMVSDTANYVFGKPIYSLGRNYSLIISAFETYTNNDNAEVDTVVVSDGKVQIINECANNKKLVTLGFNKEGKSLYQFFGGFPNLSQPYTKKLEIKLLVGETYYDWAQSPLYGYVSGNIPTGSNFVTEGPTSIDFVLRDPPGSDSYSYMEKGLEISKTVTTSSSHGQSGSENAVYHLGMTTTTTAGTPFFSTEFEFEAENNISIGVEHSENWANEFEENITINYSQVFATSADPAYVGEMGDLFLGHGNNIIYGLSNFIKILNINDVPTGNETIQDTVTIDGEDYTIAKKTGLNMGKKVSTTFIYTQNHIENYLIPNLQMLRNMVYDSNNKYYTLVCDDSDDDNFLTNNDDEFVWNSNASDDKYDGPSYIYANPDRDDLIDSVRYYNNQINAWIQVLRDNEYAKLNCKKDDNFPSNISFDAGVEYEASVEIDTIGVSSKSFEFTISPHLATEGGFLVNKNGFTFEFQEQYDYAKSTNTTNDTTSSQTIGFVLADGDQGDYFSVDIRKDVEGGFGPIFKTVGGQSGCPYEGATYTEYYEPGKLLSQATMRVEAPAISVDNNIVAGVPETDAAIFNIAMSNNTEVGADVWYNLYVEPTSNPNGAVVKMDGAPISGSAVAILVPAGQTVYKALTVEKGQLDINKYENIQIILYSQCQYDPTDDVEDIADTILISAYFSPACTEVEFAQIYDNWTANTYNNDTLSFNIKGYNINSTKFESISFQYAVPGGTRTTNMVFYKTEADFNAASEPKMWIKGSPTMTYNFPLGSLIDGNYQIYLKTTCNDGSEFITEPLNGIIDRIIPAPFGTPQPADGILSYGEDISVQFNEPINSGDLYSHIDYVDVRGMTNGTDLTYSPSLLHDASIHFDGITNNMQVNHINLDHTNFTIEFWAKRDVIDTRSNILTLGTPSQGGLWAGFDAANHFVIEIDGQTITSAKTYTNIGNWAFYSIIYNRGDQSTEQGFTLFILSDAGGIPEVFEADVFSSLEGSLSVGYCAEDGSAFNGNIHELRIWNYARTSVAISAQKGQILNGYEEGLYSLWPMTEASGTIAKDIAFGRSALVNATWHVSRDSKALAFNGTNVFSVPAGKMAFSHQSDFTVEFWYKMALPTSNFTMMSNGNPNKEQNINSWNITATSSGEIVINNNGTDVIINAQNYLNNQWHHFAMSMNRIGYLSIYLDGDLIKTQSVSSFEGFGAGRLVAGARWYNLSMNDYYDQYMTGTMDEIRVWNSARTHSQIQRYMNHTLKGDEFGLKAYFPFEDSISNENSRNFTMDTIGVAGNTLLAAMYFTSESPNMKLQRPEVSIPHSYIINNDQIIINPNIEANLIENQILDISIKRIKDMNNNMMASTLTWNAFIDKNQVVWDMQDLQITKFVEEETIVTVTIQNNGGLNENYKITNIPSWMEVSPSSGNLSPLETNEIEITIKSELNIGSYQTDINLVASMDYKERLGLDIQVKAHAPDWTVIPDDFKSTANIIGQLSINNIISTDINDIVACFVGTECRGIANVKYFKDANLYLSFMNIYANDDGETITFKVFDASTGNVYTQVTPELEFVSNRLYGSVSKPLSINATNYIEQKIDLNSGWNWLSFNVKSPNFNNLNLALSELDAVVGDQIKSDVAFTQYNTTNSTSNWIGNLLEFDNTSMYKFNIEKAQSLLFSGKEIISDTIPIAIKAGWNWIGYPLSVQSNINNALSSLNPTEDDLLKSQQDFAVYSEQLGWIGSLEYLQAGKGYMLKTNNVDTLIYSSAISNKSLKKNKEKTDFNYEPSFYSNNMTVVGTIISDGKLNISKDDIIYAFSDKKCRGIGYTSYYNNEQIFFITVNGEQTQDNMNFVLYHNETKEYYALNETISFEMNKQTGELNHPYEFNLQLTAIDEKTLLPQDIAIYPNPFNSFINIEFKKDIDGESIIEIYNSLGQRIKEIISTNNIVRWNAKAENGEAIPVGVYYIHIQTQENINIFKVVKSN